MVNGKLSDLMMKIGDFGEAYFVQETHVCVDEMLITDFMIGNCTSRVD